jgi:carbohydrate kinase (thermoresistant glucokinase family)
MKAGPDPIIVMGPSGSGKSTLGRALAADLGWCFIEGDDLHPPDNVAKMRGGTALTDEDRAPWIAQVIRTIRELRDGGLVVACSALRRQHREQIRAQAGPVNFVFPVVAREQLAPRIRQRDEHFMPLTLLDSQLADFEAPAPQEPVLRVSGALEVAQQVEQVRLALNA